MSHPYSKEGASAAETAAKAMLEMRGNTTRLYRNALVFLAADKTRLQDLDEAARKYLAWESILVEKTKLDLTPYQVAQAENQKAAADGAVTARLPETYQWLLVPTQASAQVPMTWEALRLSDAEPLAARASKKLRGDEAYLTSFGPTRLRMEMDKIRLWRGDHVSVRQLAEDFARYVYLPRFKHSGVLLDLIRDGVQLLTWAQDCFALADSFDEPTSRYRGLRGGQMVSLTDAHSPMLVVKSEVASKQIDAERAVLALRHEPTPSNGEDFAAAAIHTGSDASSAVPVNIQPKRFHGSVTLDATRVGRDTGKIAEEVIAHLVGLMGAAVTVTLEIHAAIPSGAPDNVVRTVTENSRSLKFSDHGFERE